MRHGQDYPFLTSQAGGGANVFLLATVCPIFVRIAPGIAVMEGLYFNGVSMKMSGNSQGMPLLVANSCRE